MNPDYLSHGSFVVEKLSNTRVKLMGPSFEKLALAVYHHTISTPYRTPGQTTSAKRQRAESIPMAQVRLAGALFPSPRYDWTEGIMPSILYGNEQPSLAYALYWIGKEKRLEIFTHSGAIADSRLLINTAESIGQRAVSDIAQMDTDFLQTTWSSYQGLRSYFYAFALTDRAIDRARIPDISETIWTLAHLDEPQSHSDYILDSLNLLLNKWYVPKENLKAALQLLVVDNPYLQQLIEKS